jgi:hypothetical protein
MVGPNLLDKNKRGFKSDESVDIRERLGNEYINNKNSIQLLLKSLNKENKIASVSSLSKDTKATLDKIAEALSSSSNPSREAQTRIILQHRIEKESKSKEKSNSRRGRRRRRIIWPTRASKRRSRGRRRRIIWPTRASKRRSRGRKQRIIRPTGTSKGR